MTTWTYPRSIVRRVVDADTLDVTLDLGMEVSMRARVRLAGVDAPERGTVAGNLADRFVRDLLPAGGEVTVISHERDKYGRLLGAIHLAGGESLAQLLLAAGHARPYDGGHRPPSDSAGQG